MNPPLKDDKYLTHILDYGEEPPDIPDAFALYLNMKSLGYVRAYSGEYADQPHIFLQEMLVCANAQTKFDNMQTANRRLMAKYGT